MPSCTATGDRGRGRGAGFTLLEMMVSMAFFAVLLLVMTRILADTSRSWETGRRRGETALAARMVFDLMSTELAQAVVTPEFPMAVEASSIRFHRRNPAGSSPYGGEVRRGLTLVEYRLVGTGDLRTLERRQADWAASGPQPGAPALGAREPLYGHVRRFGVRIRDADGTDLAPGSHTSPPAQVDLFLGLCDRDEASRYADLPAALQERAERRFHTRVMLLAQEGP